MTGAVEAASPDENLASETQSRRHPLVQAIRSTRGLTGLALIALVMLLAVAAPFLTHQDPQFQLPGGSELLSPRLSHLFGTDELGRDLFSRVLFGTRADLIISLGGALLGATVGSLMGLVAAIVKALDAPIQRVFDMLLAFPAIVLGIAVAVVLGPGIPTIIVAIVLINLPVFGRLVRNGVIALSKREYALAARAFGASESWIVGRHLLPNSIDPVIIQLALSAAQATLVESGMSFVGIGVQLPTPSLGNLLHGSLAYMQVVPAYAIGPMIPLVALVLGLNLLADAMTAGLLRRR